MPPAISALDQAYETAGYSVFGGDHSLESSILPDGANLILREDRPAVILAFDASATSLAYAIRDILGLSAGKEMIGIDASGRIAFVADAFPLRDALAVLDLPCVAMDTDRLLFPSDERVAVLVGVPRPQGAAALIWDGHVEGDPVSKRPVTWKSKLLRFLVSHNGTSDAVVGQGWDGASTSPSPNYLP